MTRHHLITAHGGSTLAYDWDGESTVRICWDVPGETVLELPMLPDDVALRISVEDLRAIVRQREIDAVKMTSDGNSKPMFGTNIRRALNTLRDGRTV